MTTSSVVPDVKLTEADVPVPGDRWSMANPVAGLQFVSVTRPGVQVAQTAPPGKAPSAGAADGL